METMADVLAKHQFMFHSFNGVNQRTYLKCSCGAMPLCGDHPTHLANALSIAGFGDKAEAWDRGYSRGLDLAAWGIGNRPESERPNTDNPYRGAK